MTDLSTLFIVFAWLLMLTISNGIGVGLLITLRREVRTRTAQLDIKDQLHVIMQHIDRDRLHRDRDLREAVELFIRRIEADPMSATRHHIDIVQLKHHLKP